MRSRRIKTAASLLFLGALAVCVVEATLSALVGLISSLLGQSLVIELGPANVGFAQWNGFGPEVVVFNAGTIGSLLVTAACGVGAAISRYRRWRPRA